ncbi:unnamed protein product [Ectocarpus sp. 12 AP-2014]
MIIRPTYGARLRQVLRRTSLGATGGVQRPQSTDAVIVSMARTPIGKFGGGMSALSGPKLGAIAVREAVARAEGIQPALVEEIFMGNVVSAGAGQAPSRQAAIYAGKQQARLPESAPCTTINKVCASGMKSVILAAQSLSLGHRGVMVAGGFESMSNVPYYLPQARSGLRLGNGTVVDGIIHDGLWDVYNDHHMGICAEKCSSAYGISREAQDEHATESYQRAAVAWEKGHFDEETTPVEIPSRRGPPTTITKDEEYTNIDLGKLKGLRPAFQREEGTVTAANASSLNDGAAALVLMSAVRAAELGVKPLATIRGYGDAARAPVEFTVAPSDAVPVALKNAGISLGDVDFHEINEAFSVVALANMKILGLDPARVNVNGGAVALGHPIGSSGARIICSLYHVLKQNDGTVGCASICNGGGGASAIVIERLQ